jgi:[NiFe] hydrogenase assembly HybE family chaperone
MTDRPLNELLFRVTALEALFNDIAVTRMRGIPILHPCLHVRAVGFQAEAKGHAALGVLITPWFMNLVRLPLDDSERLAGIGSVRTRVAGNERFDFIGAFEEGFGAYEACSLFSPMFDFRDDAAALATAQAVLDALRQPPPTPEVVASRRVLLFGRGAESRS